MCAKSSEVTQLLKYKAGLRRDHYDWQDYFWRLARRERIHRTKDTEVYNTREGGRQGRIKLKDCFFSLLDNMCLRRG